MNMTILMGILIVSYLITFCLGVTITLAFHDKGD